MAPRIWSGRVNQMMTAVFGGLGAVMIIVGYLSYRSSLALREASNARSQSREILLEIETLQKHLDASESGQRGYLLTGQRRYLKPYEEASNQVLPSLHLLASHTMHRKAHTKTLARLDQLIQLKLAELEETIDRRQRGDSAGALEIVSSDRGQAYMEEARTLINEMKAREQRYLERVMSAFDSQMHGSNLTVAVTTILASLTALLALLWLNQELRKRRRVEEEVTKEGQRLAAVIATQERVGLSDLDPTQIMGIIVEDVRKLTGANGAVIELIEGDEMVYRAGSGPAGSKIGMRLPAKGSFSGLSVIKREALICHDTEEDPRVNRAACRAVGVRSMIVAPLFHNGETVGVLKAFSDQAGAFTERDIDTLKLTTGLLGASLTHAAEFEAKQQAEKMALDASRLKSEFLANMSHEIRTPLNGVIGMAGLLADTRLDAVQRDHLDSIESSATALLAIVNDILDFSKIEAGKLDIEILGFDLDQIISDLGKTAALAARRKGLAFVIKAPPMLPTQFRGDPGRIRQILSNLLTNAIKFTSQGGVTLAIEPVSDSEKITTLRFEVRDTGIGIAEETLARLFTPFTQADTSTSRRFGGTGLGLSICKRLVELLGGEIGAETIKGKGSTFWFQLPLEKGTKRKSARQKKWTGAQVPELVGKRLLIAEDNHVNQKIVLALLAKFGCHTTAVNNGQEVLAALAREPFDAILMDCQMPELDGYEATKAIRAAKGQPWQAVPIIAMTANAIKGDREHCLEVGMTGYVSKPLSPNLLVDAIIAVINPASEDTNEGVDSLQNPIGVTGLLASLALSFDASVPAHSSLPVLDDETIAGLKELATGDHLSLLRELTDSFIATTPARLTAIGNAISLNDRAIISREAHALAGGSGSLGLLKLAAACRSLETIAQTAPPEVLAAMLKETESLVDEANTALTMLFSDAANDLKRPA